jgi:poly(hydroxyalkanoate) depolymerase family esterase
LPETLQKLWRRTVEALQRLAGRVPPAPGRFFVGQKASFHGFISVSPAPPWRDYMLYLPRGYDEKRRVPLVVWLHGCRQDPEAFAAGSRIASFADERGFLVLLPRQSRLANSERCWNWFDPRTAGGSGEAAIVAAQADAVMQKFPVDRRRVFIAGLSSGGALAATLALRAPHLFAGVAVHSAPPCGAASNASSAARVMAQGPRGGTDEIAAHARKDAPDGLRVPALIIQGAADTTVAPVNATFLARQFLLLNGIPLNNLPPGAALPKARRDASTNRGGTYRVSDYYTHALGRLVVRLVTIEGLGHAWSGGDAKFQHFDARAPDATQLILDFFSR